MRSRCCQLFCVTRFWGLSVQFLTLSLLRSLTSQVILHCRELSWHDWWSKSVIWLQNDDPHMGDDGKLRMKSMSEMLFVSVVNCLRCHKKDWRERLTSGETDVNFTNIFQDRHHEENLPIMRKFTQQSDTYFVRGSVCRWHSQKMQSESNGNIPKTSGFFTNRWRIEKFWRMILTSTRRKFDKLIEWVLK